MTIIAMIISATAGAGIMALFNGHSYDKGQFDGEISGYEEGYRAGFNDAYVRVANVVPFPQEEVHK